MNFEYEWDTNGINNNINEDMKRSNSAELIVFCLDLVNNINANLANLLILTICFTHNYSR